MMKIIGDCIGFQGGTLMIIKIFELFNVDTLRHRDTAKKIIEMIPEQPENGQVMIDFENIAFATRSFINELLSGVYDRNVKFINVNPDLKQMMDLVSESSSSDSKAPA